MCVCIILYWVVCWHIHMLGKRANERARSALHGDWRFLCTRATCTNAHIWLARKWVVPCEQRTTPHRISARSNRIIYCLLYMLCVLWIFIVAPFLTHTSCTNKPQQHHYSLRQKGREEHCAPPPIKTSARGSDRFDVRCVEYNRKQCASRWWQHAWWMHINYVMG